jgi:hypothetical protein
MNAALAKISRELAQIRKKANALERNCDNLQRNLPMPKTMNANQSPDKPAAIERPERVPFRVQLSRKKGWRKPDNTVVVSRPSIFGNPFWKGFGCRMDAAWKYQCAVEAELFAMKLGFPVRSPYFRRIAENLPKLRGKNLACWCPLDVPDSYCHAGKLLEMAKR